MKIRIILATTAISVFLWGCEDWGGDYGEPAVGDDEVARIIAPSIHDGYFVAGEKYYGDDDSDQADLFLARFTEGGRTEWMTSYSTGMHNEPLAARETGDHGLLVLATRSHRGGVPIVYLLSIDANGHARWRQDVATAGLTRVVDAEVTGDGGFVILGYSGSGDATTLLGIDPGGGVRFRRTFGTSAVPVSVHETTGGFVFLSNVARNDDSSTVRLNRVDSWGDPLWTSTIWSWGWWVAWHVTEDPGGGYYIVGERNSGSPRSRPLVIKTDARGGFLWRQDYPEAEGSAVYAVVPARGGLLLAGDMNYGADHDGFALRTTAGGEWQWWRTYGESRNDWIAAAIPGNYGGYVLAGTSASFSPAGDTDFYLAKISSDGALVWETADGE